MNIFGWSMFLLVVGFLSFIVYLAIHVNERNERNTKLCSDHSLSSIHVNRGNTILCVDPKSGMVFYLR